MYVCGVGVLQELHGRELLRSDGGARAGVSSQSAAPRELRDRRDQERPAHRGLPQDHQGS